MFEVKPVTRELLASRAFALRDLVFMMRKDQINPAGVKVERLAKIFHRHRRTFDVPAGPATPYFSVPRGLFGSVRGLPQCEIARVFLFVFVGVDALAATEQALKDFEAGMDDDLNTSVALATVHELTREVNTALARRALREDNKREIIATINRFDSVLNVFGEPQLQMLDDDIQKLIDERQEARHRRDFDRADEIRDELAQRGIVLEDTKDGVRWKRR